MALLETQPLRANASAAGAPQAPAAAATRSSVSFALSAGITPFEHAGATTLLFEYRDNDRYRHGPHRPGPYRPGPYFPRPIPMPYPIPSPIPGPLPGERACSFFEEGRWGSRQDIFGRWWCRW